MLDFILRLQINTTTIDWYQRKISDEIRELGLYCITVSHVRRWQIGVIWRSFRVQYSQRCALNEVAVVCICFKHAFYGFQNKQHCIKGMTWGEKNKLSFTKIDFKTGIWCFGDKWHISLLFDKLKDLLASFIPSNSFETTFERVFQIFITILFRSIVFR